MAENKIEKSSAPREDLEKKVADLEAITDHGQFMDEAMSIAMQAALGEDPYHDNSSIVDGVYAAAEARMQSVGEQDPQYDAIQQKLATLYVYSGHPEKGAERAATIVDHNYRNNSYMLAAEGLAKQGNFEEANTAVGNINEDVEFGQDARGSGFRLNARLRVLVEAFRHQQDLAPVFAQLKADIAELRDKTKTAHEKQGTNVAAISDEEYESGAKSIFQGMVSGLETEESIDANKRNGALIEQIKEEFPEYF